MKKTIYAAWRLASKGGNIELSFKKDDIDLEDPVHVIKIIFELFQKKFGTSWTIYRKGVDGEGKEVNTFEDLQTYVKGNPGQEWIMRHPGKPEGTGHVVDLDPREKERLFLQIQNGLTYTIRDIKRRHAYVSFLGLAEKIREVVPNMDRFQDTSTLTLLDGSVKVNHIALITGDTESGSVSRQKSIQLYIQTNDAAGGRTAVAAALPEEVRHQEWIAIYKQVDHDRDIWQFEGFTEQVQPRLRRQPAAADVMEDETEEGGKAVQEAAPSLTLNSCFTDLLQQDMTTLTRLPEPLQTHLEDKIKQSLAGAQ